MIVVFLVQHIPLENKLFRFLFTATCFTCSFFTLYPLSWSCRGFCSVKRAGRQFTDPLWSRFILWAGILPGRPELQKQATDYWWTRERKNWKRRICCRNMKKEIAVYKAQHRKNVSVFRLICMMKLGSIRHPPDEWNCPEEDERRCAGKRLDSQQMMCWIKWMPSSGVWNSNNDTLDNLVLYPVLVAEYPENTPVFCRFTTPEQIPEKDIVRDKRRNIFLCEGKRWTICWNSAASRSEHQHHGRRWTGYPHQW